MLKLKGLLDYYLESRGVKDFAQLCELLVCDRIKSVLSEGCLKYVLSIESASKPGWLAMRDLTEAIDRYTAAHSVIDKPISFAVGQTPIKSSDSATVLPHTGPNAPASKVTSSTAGRGRGGGVGLMNDSRRCHHCGVFGHIRPMCPELRGTSKARAAGVKRVSVGARHRHGIDEQGAGEMQAVASVGPCQAKDQTGVNLSAPTDASGAAGLESVVAMSRNNVDVSPNVVNEMAAVNACSSVSNVVSELSALKYVDVSVTCDNTDVVKNVVALCDSGAEMCCVKSDLITDLSPNVVGQIQLRPFCGPPELTRRSVYLTRLVCIRPRP